MIPDKSKIQYYYTLPKALDASTYQISVEIERFGQRTIYEFGCEFNKGVSTRQKVEGFLGFIKEATELSMLYQNVLDSGVLFDDDFLNQYGGEDVYD